MPSRRRCVVDAGEPAMGDMPMNELWNPALAQMQPYAVPDSHGLIKLDAMENPFALPADLARRFAGQVGHLATNRYPDAGATALKTAIVEQFPVGDEFGCVLGNGSDELIAMLMQAVLRPGATVLAAEPCFVMYRHLAAVLGLRFVGVPLTAAFELDMPAMCQAIEEHQPALVFIASPNNPTGNRFADADLEVLAGLTPGLFVLDEAYIPYAGGDGRALARSYPQVVLLRTLSKWGLAGLRLGFVQARGRVCEQLEKVRMPYNINVLSQALGTLCLQHAEAFAEQIQQLVRGREQLTRELSADGVTVYPSAANFVLVRCRDARATHAALKSQRILVKLLHGAHPRLEQCLRISVGSPAENRALLEVWPEALQA